MADKVKDVTQTPTPPQLSSDDNRRRTRSQTRNGGIATPPAPVPEAKGRKRSSQSQPGSGSKRGRKPANKTPVVAEEKVDAAPASESAAGEKGAAAVDEASTATKKDTKAYSKQAENQDLSKRKPTDTDAVSGKPTEESKAEDVDIEPVEEVLAKSQGTEDSKQKSGKKHEAQSKAPAEAGASSENICKLKKVEPAAEAKGEPQAATKDEAKEAQQKEEPVKSTEAAKASVENSCALPKKVESGASDTTSKAEPTPKKSEGATDAVVGEEKNQTAKGAQVAGSCLKKQQQDQTLAPDSEPKTTSEQPKIDASNEKLKSETELAAREKTANNSVDNKEKNASVEKQTIVQESGDGKLDTANNDEAKKADETKVNDQANSATPV